MERAARRPGARMRGTTMRRRVLSSRPLNYAGGWDSVCDEKLTPRALLEQISRPEATGRVLQASKALLKFSSPFPHA
jgi:hypothetical protein